MEREKLRRRTRLEEEENTMHSLRGGSLAGLEIPHGHAPFALLWPLPDMAAHIPAPLLLPAVHYRGPRPRASVDVVSDSSHKLDQRLGGLWDSVVWPYCVVKVTDEPVCVQLLLLQGWRADDEKEGRLRETQGLRQPGPT